MNMGALLYFQNIFENIRRCSFAYLIRIYTDDDLFKET